MTTRKIVAVMGDQHANFRFGLCNPETILDEGDEKIRPSLTYHQKTLWQFYKEDRESLRKLAGSDEIVFFNLGELCHGFRFKSELVSTYPVNQYKIAVANLESLLDMPNIKHVRLLKGTASHEDGPGSAASTVGDMLQLKYKKKDIRVRYHFKTDVDGIDFDYAHHGPGPGIRDWLSGNVLVLYAQSIADKLLKEGKNPPGAILRSHFHQYRLRISSRWARGKLGIRGASLCRAIPTLRTTRGRLPSRPLP